MIVTNWNEWWENTEIEPSQRYGTVYLAATRKWTELFKNGRTSCGSCGGSTPESGNRREEVAVAGERAKTAVRTSYMLRCREDIFCRKIRLKRQTFR